MTEVSGTVARLESPRIMVPVIISVSGMIVQAGVGVNVDDVPVTRNIP